MNADHTAYLNPAVLTAPTDGQQQQQQQQQQQHAAIPPSQTAMKGVTVTMAQNAPLLAGGMGMGPPYQVPNPYPPVAYPHHLAGMVPYGAPYAAPYSSPQFAPMRLLPTTVATAPGAPPLMPMVSSHMQWECINREMVYMGHCGPRCTICPVYIQHVTATWNEPQYVQAHKEARAEQQNAYYAHFERWQSARGEVARAGDKLRQLWAENKRLEDETRKQREWQEDLKQRLIRAWDAHDMQCRRADQLQDEVDRLSRRREQSRSPRGDHRER